ncbi:PREDICTED: uncharacterized protein LOC109116509 [Tarenaya hassleriana]|uniref:uncharacterized protein LOC109116509 n=1 Tax=Tarenaya hassleriana TaxID=28532 RepID=UPI0008FD188F|nr:PREDICTED: uncharacterized protein LOC109116509 [Tarenaya hassleriana]
MVQDAFPSQYNDQVTEDPMNEASKKFFDLLEAANQPIYDGCKEGLSQLSASARLMGMKTSYNLTENCMNEVCQMLNDYLPQDGFAPYGQSGKQYSLWPIVMSPYNLPPDMCLKKEFLFLTVLIPGPEHPKKSFDIFLQPLIEELLELWHCGIDAYDASQKENFRLKAILMWTISDFPAYGMLSGWSTHGRLACPYCMDDIQSFQLRHGRKSCWFDCHRRFLSLNHPWRWNKINFRKNKIVTDSPPLLLTGEEILWERIESIHGLDKTIDCGGNGHRKPCEYGETHNWYKRSIFWDLPYWRTHKLRHNLDVMHIEKNFFDNVINTIMNVKGKSKDNVKSRMDIKEICNRKELELSNDGKATISIFRLSKSANIALLKWLKEDVQFSDGYASNIGRCADIDGVKLNGMKSHDCHVFMKRLLPVALVELVPRNVYEPLCGISTFFRDICSRNLNVGDVQRMKENIPLILKVKNKNKPEGACAYIGS